jgi:hypothetical protein
MFYGRLLWMEGNMVRKLMMALFAVAAVGLVQPTAALARGGGGGGMGGHGGGGMGGHGVGGMGGHAVMGGGGGGMGGHVGMGGGMGGHVGMGGGFHSAGIHPGFGGGRFHGFHDRFHRRAFVGFGVGPYAYYDDYPYYYDDGCYIVRHRVMTRHGWRIRPVQVCG